MTNRPTGKQAEWCCITYAHNAGDNEYMLRRSKGSRGETRARSCLSWLLLRVMSHSSVVMAVVQVGWGQGMGNWRSSSLEWMWVWRQVAQKRCRQPPLTCMLGCGTSSKQMVHESVDGSWSSVRSTISARLPACRYMHVEAGRSPSVYKSSGTCRNND